MTEVNANFGTWPEAALDDAVGCWDAFQSDIDDESIDELTLVAVRLAGVCETHNIPDEDVSKFCAASWLYYDNALLAANELAETFDPVFDE